MRTVFMIFLLLVPTIGVAESTFWVTDGHGDGEEIQKAIDTAQEQGGGVIYLLPGHYNLSDDTPQYPHWVIFMVFLLALSLIANIVMSGKLLKLFCLAAALLLVPAAAHAEEFHVIGRKVARLDRIGDFNGWQYPGYAYSEIKLMLDFDWSRNTMTYGDFTITEPEGIAFTGRKTYTVGPGQIDEVTVRVTIDPFTFASSNSTQATITPTEGGAYDILGPPHPIDGPLQLTGTWTATGPSTTKEGTWSRNFGGNPSIQYTRMLTAGYPSLTMQWEAEAVWNGGGLFSTNVDGYPVSVGLGSIAYDLRHADAVPINHVPEPSAFLLLSIGLVCFGLHVRSHRVRASE